jgi:polysaccharide pyruvyl transferase WcaK-like protein
LKSIALFDTSIATLNLGDRIIIDSVLEELQGLFLQDFVQTIPTHLPLDRNARRIASNSSFTIVGGTNLLTSHMNNYRQWKVTLWDAVFLSTVVLMGVGWWQYQAHADLYTRMLLKRILHSTMYHSVRDRYTAQQLDAAGIDNVLVTGCPTMWGLSEEHCFSIPRDKGNAVVTTITDYTRDHQADRKQLEYLLNNYTQVFIWQQGSQDLSYLKELSLNHPSLTMIPSNVAAYNKLLSSHENIDYVGSRLHAGIRALQYGRRSIIIGIDNRATEMHKDFGLPVVARGDIETLQQMIETPFTTALNMPWEAINTWKQQFRKQ